MSAVPTQLQPYAFKAGNPGRVNGSQNKISSYVRLVLAGTFDAVGGIEAFQKWAKDNPTDYYCRLWIKLLPDSSQLSEDEREKVLNAMLGVPQVLTQLYEGELVKDTEIKPESQVEQSVDTSQASPVAPSEAISPPDVSKAQPQ